MKSLSDRFWEKVDFLIPESDCWEWTGNKSPRGYGSIKVGKNNVAAHRASYYLNYGYFPGSKECVCHRCDNPSCVNPDHLFLGSQRDNMQDMVRKGRGANLKGVNNPRAKLSPELVMEIRHCWDSGVSPKDISAKFGIPKSTINKIVSGETWSHLPLCKKPPSNRGSLLCEYDVNEIRRLYSLNVVSQEFIGKMFKISQPQVSKIVLGDSWT